MTASDPIMINRQTPPATSLIAPLPFSLSGKHRLSNNVPVYLIMGGTEDIVRIELLFSAGSYFQHKPLVTYSAASLLKSGTSSKTSREISEILDFYGAFFQIDAQKDIVSVSIFVLQKYLEPVLELFQEIIREPVFQQKELDIFLRNQKHQHIINSRKVAHLARLYFGEQLFGQHHPYGYRLRKSDFEKINRDDLLAFHNQWLQPRKLSIIVSGKLPANLPQLLENHFGATKWKRGENSQPEPTFAVLDNGRQKLLIQKDEALQSAIRIGKRTINRNHADFHRLAITNALLGGFFGSRLMKKIRQEKGFTYGINSALVSLVHDGYFFVNTQVGVDVCQEAIDQIYQELKKLRTLPASPDELQTLKNYMAGNFLRSFDGPFAQAERFREMLVFGLATSNFDQFLLELKNCTPETIMQTAAQYLHEDSMTEVVAGKY